MMAVAEGFEPSVAAVTVRCLTNLATPQKFFAREKNRIDVVLWTNLAAATRVELVPSRLQDERSESN